ncbi:hypothetical protein DFS34DRAFT_597837 [Phlyctochytrium arcticum]|nr:hypothetical protein DFS34DRAFT_597837 [Phlyctochytrium arcticum]
MSRVRIASTPSQDREDSVFEGLSQDLLGLGLGDSQRHFGDMDMTQDTIRGLGNGQAVVEIADEETTAMDRELERRQQELYRLRSLAEVKRAKRLKLAELERQIEAARSDLESLDVDEPGRSDGESSHVPTMTAQRQFRNPFETPVAGSRLPPPDTRQFTRGSATTTNPFTLQHPASSGILVDKLEDVKREKLMRKLQLIREGVVPEIRFKGKVGETDRRALMDFEAEVRRAFEEQEVDLGDMDPRFQRLLLLLVRYFLHPDGKAYEMYQQRINSWKTYDDFLEELYLRFLRPNSDAAVIAEWEPSIQGSKSFLEWKAELDKLWETVGAHMDRHIYMTNKVGARLHRLTEVELVDEMGLEDQFRIAQRKEKGTRGAVSAPTTTENVHVPREQYNQMREKWRAEMKKEGKGSSESQKSLGSAGGSSSTSSSGQASSSVRSSRKVETPEEYAKRVAGLTCFKCNKKGHISTICPNGARMNATLVRRPEMEPSPDADGSAVGLQRSKVDGEGQPEGGPSPAARFVQGGRSYADVVTAWNDGRRRVKPEKTGLQEEGVKIGPPLPPPPSTGIPTSASVAIPKKSLKKAPQDRQPRAADKKGTSSKPSEWKGVVGNPNSIGNVYSIVAKVGGAEAVLLVDSGANVQMLDTRFVKLHRFSQTEHSQRRKIATGFKGSYGTSAAGTVQVVEVNDRSDRVYFEVGAIDGFDGILGTEWLEAVGAQQCWATDKLIVGGTITERAQKSKTIRAITATVATDENALSDPPVIDPTRTIGISESGPAMFPAWASALEELEKPGSALTVEQARGIVSRFGEEIGVIRPYKTLPPGLPPLRKGMNHTFVMKQDAPPLPKRAIRYPVKYEAQMREKEAKYVSDGRWYRSSDPEAVPTFVVPKGDISKARMVFDERARNQQKELVRYTLPHTDGSRFRQPIRSD